MRWDGYGRRAFGNGGTSPWVPEELLRYLGVGVVNLVVGLSTIYLCISLFHATDFVANVLGYAVGILCSFMLNRRWTFASSGWWAPQLLRFLGVLGVAYVANLATVLGLIKLFGTNRYLAQALGAVPYTVIGYIGSSAFAFRRSM